MGVFDDVVYDYPTRKPTARYKDCTDQDIEHHARLIDAIEAFFTCQNCKQLPGANAPVNDSGWYTITDAELLALIHGVSVDQVIDYKKVNLVVGDSIIYKGSIEQLRGLPGTVTDVVLVSDSTMEYRYSVVMRNGAKIYRVRGKSLQLDS